MVRLLEAVDLGALPHTGLQLVRERVADLRRAHCDRGREALVSANTATMHARPESKGMSGMW